MIYKFDRQFCADGLTMGQMKLEIKRRGWWAGKIDTDRLINGDGRIMIVRVARSVKPPPLSKEVRHEPQ